MRFFLGGGGEEGRVENFGIFFGKSVGPPLRLIQKPPEALPLSDWQKCDPPLTTTR